MEFAGYDDRLTRARLDALERGAAAVLREPTGPVKREEWFGWRPMTWDDLPILGAVPGQPGLWLAVGHGMMGMGMSAVTGRLLADLVTKRTPVIDPTPYAITRFR
jgi:D-amino-acid dehydrogenase